MTQDRLFRVGVLVPSSNTVVEDYCHTDLDHNSRLRLHFGRVSVTQISPDASSLAQFEETGMRAAFDLLAEAQPDRLIWGGTAAGWLGFDTDRHLCDLVERRTGIPATTSLLATNDRLRTLGVKCIGLVTPYGQAIEDRIVANYRAAGIDVAGSERLNITVNTEYAQVSPDRLADMAQAVAGNGAEAIVILCTNLRGAQIVASAGKRTGLPILDSVVETLRPLLGLASGAPRRSVSTGIGSQKT